MIFLEETIYGKNKKFFNQKLKGKIKYENFNNVKDGLKKIFMLIKDKKSYHFQGKIEVF